MSHRPGKRVVSVVVLSKGDGALVRRLLVQLHRAEEIIVLETGDSSYVKSLPRREGLKVVCPGGGRGAQLNNGAKRASGEVLWFLRADADVCRIPLESVGCSSGWGCFSLRFRSRHMYLRVVEWTAAFRARRGLVLGDQGLFVSRALFDRCGGFEEGGAPEFLSLSLRLRQLSRPDLSSQVIYASARRFQRYGHFFTHLMFGFVLLALLLGFGRTARRLQGFVD